VIYLDTSALAKLVAEEPESAALERWLDERPGPLLTSVLAEVELALTLTRRRVPVVLGEELLRGVVRLEITSAVRRRAALVGSTAATLRTLDALHVASALELDALAPGSLTVATYDARIAAASTAAGLATAAPS